MTATLPHTDWLLEVHFSDGSVMEVTEDHRFWSVSDSGWVELQDLDNTDVLLTPDGVTVTVDYLDWDAGATAPAWDLTVAEEHNFFVAADATAEPVLVHNQTRGILCGVRISSERFLDNAAAIEAVKAALAQASLTDGVGDVLRGLRPAVSDTAQVAARKQATVDRVIDGLVSVSDSPTMVRQLGRNLVVDDNYLATIPDMSQELFEQVFTRSDIGSLPVEARSVLIRSGTSSVDAIRLQDRFGIEIRPTSPWGPPPTASPTSAEEVQVAEILHAQVDEAGAFVNRVEFAEESGTIKFDIDGELAPRDQLRLEADPNLEPEDLPRLKNPEYLINGRWYDVFSPEGANPINNALEKVLDGQTQRVIITVRGDTQMADVLAAWDAKLEEVSDLPGPLGQILGYPADTARFPLADLQVIDLDAADPLTSMVRLFSQ